MPTLAIRPIDEARLEASKQLDPARRSQLGQFMTPTAIADFMASLFTRWPQSVRLLDPGAGVGSLTESFAEHFLISAPANASLETHCYEIEPLLQEYLSDHLREVTVRCKTKGHSFSSAIHNLDFIAEASFEIGMGAPRFTHAILNPPYKKINTDSAHRKMLRQAGIETVNLYTAFLGLAVAMLEEGGEVVAIVPRSFCNGPYYRPFRAFLLERAALTHIHVFESRTRAFKDDEVLQENIIVRLVRGARQGSVMVSMSHDQSFSDHAIREIPFAEIVKPGDPEQFIHVPAEPVGDPSPHFSHTLEDLELEVSTGPVVDFRLKEHWLAEPKGRCVPLLYTHHFRGGQFTWPMEHKKPNALRLSEDTRKWLMPRGCYVLTKRFSAKEERRRVVAYVIEPKQLEHEHYGFENHLNVFHHNKQGLPADLAHGLGLFLNSTIVDRYFRNFSGHTQVNATDLRSMRYPSKETLIRFGKWASVQQSLSQEDIDRYIENENAK
jgi:adenine-specific DNA-methyltransferase